MNTKQAVICPKCRVEKRVGKRKIGKSIKCSTCKNRFIALVTIGQETFVEGGEEFSTHEIDELTGATSARSLQLPCASRNVVRLDKSGKVGKSGNKVPRSVRGVVDRIRSLQVITAVGLTVTFIGIAVVIIVIVKNNSSTRSDIESTAQHSVSSIGKLKKDTAKEFQSVRREMDDKVDQLRIEITEEIRKSQQDLLRTIRGDMDRFKTSMDENMKREIAVLRQDIDEAFIRNKVQMSKEKYLMLIKDAPKSSPSPKPSALESPIRGRAGSLDKEVAKWRLTIKEAVIAPTKLDGNPWDPGKIPIISDIIDEFSGIALSFVKTPTQMGFVAATVLVNGIAKGILEHFMPPDIMCSIGICNDGESVPYRQYSLSKIQDSYNPVWDFSFDMIGSTDTHDMIVFTFTDVDFDENTFLGSLKSVFDEHDPVGRISVSIEDLIKKGEGSSYITHPLSQVRQYSYPVLAIAYDLKYIGPARLVLGVQCSIAAGYISVVSVVSGSGAENSGILVGDFIHAVDGVNVKSVNDIQDVLSKHKPYDHVIVEVSKNGNRGSSRFVYVQLRHEK